MGRRFIQMDRARRHRFTIVVKPRRPPDEYFLASFATPCDAAVPCLSFECNRLDERHSQQAEGSTTEFGAGLQTTHVRILSHTGKLSCFLAGISTFLPRSIASARAMRFRVECGMITSSM